MAYCSGRVPPPIIDSYSDLWILGPTFSASVHRTPAVFAIPSAVIARDFRGISDCRTRLICRSINIPVLVAKPCFGCSFDIIDSFLDSFTTKVAYICTHAYEHACHYYEYPEERVSKYMETQLSECRVQVSAVHLSQSGKWSGVGGLIPAWAAAASK